MNWNDTGFLISKSRYSENSLITEIFTKDHGKISGIIFGGTSKKIRNYLQIGNQLYVDFNSKSESKIGYFKIEILKAYSPIYFEEAKKLNCIISAMNLIKLFTAESQTNTRIYDLINEFYIILSDNGWLTKYIFWELKLLSILGYNLNFDEIVNKKVINNKILYFAKSKDIPLVKPSNPHLFIL